MALFIIFIFIIIATILIGFGILLIILPKYDEGEIILIGIITLVIGVFLLVIGIKGVEKEGQTIKPIEYKQVITTSPTLGKTKSNKDTIIYYLYH